MTPTSTATPIHVIVDKMPATDTLTITSTPTNTLTYSSTPTWPINNWANDQATVTKTPQQFILILTSTPTPTWTGSFTYTSTFTPSPTMTWTVVHVIVDKMPPTDTLTITPTPTNTLTYTNTPTAIINAAMSPTPGQSLWTWAQQAGNWSMTILNFPTPVSTLTPTQTPAPNGTTAATPFTNAQYVYDGFSGYWLKKIFDEKTGTPTFTPVGTLTPTNTFTNTFTPNLTATITYTPTVTNTPLGQGCQDPVTKKLDYQQAAAPSATPSPGIPAVDDARLINQLKSYSSPTPGPASNGNYLNVMSWFAQAVTMFSQGNGSVTALGSASATRSASVTLGDFTKPDMARCLKVTFDVTTVTGSGIFTLAIDGKDATSGKYINQLLSANVIAVTTNSYTIFPGATAVANVTVNDIVYPIFRIRLTLVSGTSQVSAVGINYSP